MAIILYMTLLFHLAQARKYPIKFQKNWEIDQFEFFRKFFSFGPNYDVIDGITKLKHDEVPPDEELLQERSKIEATKEIVDLDMTASEIKEQHNVRGTIRVDCFENAKFYRCPYGQIIGQVVSFNGKECIFPPCPEECPHEEILCFDSGEQVTLKRLVSLDCEFPVCSKFVYEQRRNKQQHLVDQVIKHQVRTAPPKQDFHNCPNDKLPCPNGTLVSRDPKNACHFFACV